MAADPIATLLAFASVQMAAEVKFRGGFSGTGTALKNERDAVRAIAALEPDAGGRWASLQDGHVTAISRLALELVTLPQSGHN